MKCGWRQKISYSARHCNTRILSFVGHTFLQLIRVAQILGAASRLLVPNQRTSSNEACCDAVQFAVPPVRPGIFEADTGNRIKKINPIRTHAQLNYLTDRKKIFRSYGQTSESKFRKHPQDLLKVLFACT